MPPFKAELVRRIVNFETSFERVFLAQVKISLIDTALTGLYLYLILPLFGVELPFKLTVLVIAFIVGLIPVAGNLISNTIIIILSLGASLYVAVASLVFLVIIHKLEYFLNAKIIGSEIESSAWELLVAMVVFERIFGVGGIIVGALIGMALSALSFIIRGRSRDLVSSQQVVAQRYAVLASADIDRAYQILQRTPGNRARVVRPRTEEQRQKKDSVGFFPDGRPRFGAATKDGEVPAGTAVSEESEAVSPTTPQAAAPDAGAPVSAEVASTPQAPAPITVSAPENAVSEREDAPASSPEKDQTEA